MRRDVQHARAGDLLERRLGGPRPRQHPHARQDGAERLRLLGRPRSGSNETVTMSEERRAGRRRAAAAASGAPSLPKSGSATTSGGWRLSAPDLQPQQVAPRSSGR